jgi:Domain of unknown function (DUF4403)
MKTLPLLFSLACVIPTSAYCEDQISVPTPPPLQSTPIAAPPQSSIAVTIGANLTQVCNQVSGLIPFNKIENPSHQCFQYGIYFNPPLRCSGSGNNLHVEGTVSFRAGQRCGIGSIGHISCGFDSDPIKHAIISVDSTVAWDPSWHVDAAPKIDVQVDKCDLSALNINATNFVKGKIQGPINQLSGRLPGLIAGATNFQPQAAAAWADLQKPVKVSANPPVWLVINPQYFGMSNIGISGNAVDLALQLQSSPELVVGSDPPNGNVSLPPLRTVPVSNSFHIPVTATASWDAASEVLNSALVGKEYEKKILFIPLADVKVQRVTVSGSQNYVAVGVTVAGSVNGTIFLTGQPRYDEKTASFVVDNLDYTLETKSAFKIADWILHSALRDELAAHAHFPVDQGLSAAQAQLKTALNRDLGPHITLVGTVQPISGVQLLVEQQGLMARAVVDGTANMTLH